MSDRIFPKVPGAHGGSMAATKVNSIRNCRLRANSAPTIRGVSQAGVSGGFTTEAHPALSAEMLAHGLTMSKSAKRHAKRRLNRGTQRRKV